MVIKMDLSILLVPLPCLCVKKTLRKSVVQKFKEEITDTIETFEDVIDYCNNFFKKEERKKFNELVNSIRICDPAGRIRTFPCFRS
ncbi:hypothetical protein [Elizabethkingia anophelis]|uniref:Uncharacterized protein n=1 Tax=Elizabethkingia anophelis TaxID=1117645 RepID=A0A7Z7LZT5_9FLAO|nr:hypothetical protein [Elizabethkingia anophelis]STF08844.1 Uncharacterised protein [Elizabethkingia anophelis]